MASNEEVVQVATFRDYDPKAAEEATAKQSKPAPKAAAEKKEN